MVVKEQLRNIFPKTINKSGKVFSSLVANDKGDASIEKELTSLLNYMDSWKNISNIYESSGTALQYMTNFFTYLEQFKDEKESVFLDRIAAIFVRNHDVVWGTPSNVIHTFRQYFKTDKIYLVENTADKSENLITNFQFDDLDGWIVNDVSKVELSPEARFVKSNGVKLKKGGSISVELEAKKLNSWNYFHIFYQGKINISATNCIDYKWDYITEQNKSVPINQDFESLEWDDASVPIYTNHDTFTITIKALEDDVYLDYARLFQKKKNPSFTLLVQFTGDSSKNALALSPGEADPSEEIGDYNVAGYYDQDFLTGANSGYAIDLYKELLTYVKAVGVKAYLEIVNRDKDK